MSKWKYQYDEYYFQADKAGVFRSFDNIEDEEAFASYLSNGR